MTTNINPVFPDTANVNWCKLITANTAYDGTGAVGICYVAGSAKAGSLLSRVDYLTVTNLGSNPATVIRAYLNNGDDPTVATNNTLLRNITMGLATTSQVAALAEGLIQLDMTIPAGYRIIVSTGTAGTAGWQVTGFGGDI